MHNVPNLKSGMLADSEDPRLAADNFEIEYWKSIC